jgi:septal ring factor EnvC (AmiA/AmiB activator)
MENFAKALGIANPKKATEAQIIEAIVALQTSSKDLQNDKAKAAAQIKSLQESIENVTRNNANLAEHNTELKQKVDELNEVIANMTGATNDAALSDEEAIAEAMNKLEHAGLKSGWAVNDGSVFFGENEATQYASANRLAAIGEVKL